MATNYYVLDENLKRAMVQVVNQHLASFQPRPRQRRRARRGGGSDGATATSTFAVVHEEATGAAHTMDGLNPGSAGKCQLCDGEMQVIPPGPGETLQDVLVEFKSLHRVPCVVGAFIKLHSIDKIMPGSSFGQNSGRIWGELVDAVDELYELDGAAPLKVLFLPEDETSAADIKWDGVECP